MLVDRRERLIGSPSLAQAAAASGALRPIRISIDADPGADRTVEDHGRWRDEIGSMVQAVAAVVRSLGAK